MNKQFSVLLSLYNNENPLFLKEALQSILLQTLTPTEVIIVFDGYVDKPLEDVVFSFEDKLNNLKVVRLPENVGLGKALNEGLKFCNYQFVARMDTDDICYPLRFEKQLDYLENNPDTSVVGAFIQEFNLIPGDLGVFRKLPVTYAEIAKFAKYRNPLNHPAVFFDKNHVLAAGSYSHMPLFEDFFLWIRMLNMGFVIVNLNESLLHFRTGNDMIGRRHGYGYLRKELKFLGTIKDIGFIGSYEYMVSVLTKVPLRLLPKSFLKFIYIKLLR